MMVHDGFIINLTISMHKVHHQSPRPEQNINDMVTPARPGRRRGAMLLLRNILYYTLQGPPSLLQPRLIHPKILQDFYIAVILLFKPNIHNIIVLSS